MDIKTLKSFIAVAKHNSFSQAARELNTVQPAISRHISALESELAVSLFKRNSRDVVITQAGMQLLKYAKTIIAQTEQAKTQAQRAHNGQLGTLNIAYLGSACLVFMASLVRAYKSKFPYVHISLFEMTASKQIDAFKNGQIDIGLSRPLPSSIADEYTQHCLYVDKLVAIVNEDHHFANKQKINLQDLKNEKFIMFNRDEAIGLFDEIIMLCKQASFSPNIISQPRNMQTLITEVAADLGVAIAPFCVSKLYYQGCQFINLENISTEIPVQIQHHKNNSNEMVSAFIELALQAKNDIKQDMT